MKIVQLTKRFYPDHGGVENHVRSVTRELVLRGHEVRVITLSQAAKAEDELPKIATRLHVVGEQNPFLHKLSVWSGILQNFSMLWRADVIQVHDVFWWIIPFIPFFYGKIYMTFHGYEPPGPPTQMQRFWHKLAFDCSRRSLGVGRIQEKWYGIKPHLTVFGAISQSLFEGREKYPPDKGRQSAMYLGRVSDDIGIMQYLKAMVVSGNTAGGLHVCGDGPKMKDAKAYAKKHLKRAYFAGNVPGAVSLAQTHTFAFASSYLSIIELLSLGMPVIAYYGNELKKDYLLNTPFSEWILPAGSVPEIAAHIKSLSRSSSKMKFPPEKAVEWARSQTWDKMAVVYERLWAS